MATFGKKTFSHASYASFRPSYPKHLYDILLGFHRGPRRLLVDLGSGHGLICRSLAANFEQVIGTDPSAGMIEQARLATNKHEYPHVDFAQSRAESLPFLDDNSVDMVVAGQAAHWFNGPNFFQEMKRILRPSGTLAFWGYSDHIFRDFPGASHFLHETAYGQSKDLLGPYWEQPGRSIIQNCLRDIQPPQSEWEIDRREYDPADETTQSREGKLVMEQRLPVAQVMEYIRTWSSYHGWQEKHPGQKAKKAGGSGDVVDLLFEEIREFEPEWKGHPNWLEKEVDIAWGTAVILARRKGK